MRPLIKKALFSGTRLGGCCLLVTSAATLCLGQNSGTDRKIPTLISADGYAHLLDSLFPREAIASVKVGYTMILRFEPNLGPESQLLFRAWNDGHIDAQMWTVKSGSAWSVGNSFIARTGKEDISAIAGLVGVEKRQIDVSAPAVQAWHASLFGIMRLSDSQLEKAAVEYFKDGTTNAVLDGTRYEFWYSQGMVESRWTFFDIDANDALNRANLPLARWMNTVRLAVGKH